MANEPIDREKSAKFLQAEIARLQAREQCLTAEKAALIQEFILADDNDAPEAVRKNLKLLTLPALEVLQELMVTSKSDGVRASIAKYVIDRGLMPNLIGGDSASKELSKLFKDLQEEESGQTSGS